MKSAGVLTAVAVAIGVASAHPTHSRGEWVWIHRGSDSVRAYVARPEGKKQKVPAVIVIHEIFGLTEWEPTVADRLARAGYVAVVPDLLSRRYGMSPSAQDSGRALIATLTPDDVTGDLDAVFSWLNANNAVQSGEIGVMGFCWGGGQTFRYATNNPRLKAAVVCYGPAPDTSAMGRIEAPILGIYGENDARINSALPMVQAQMDKLGKRFTPMTFPGTGHGFLKPGRQGSDGPEVEKAWTRILGFFGETLARR